jgi:hypothetical protein
MPENEREKGLSLPRQRRCNDRRTVMFHSKCGWHDACARQFADACSFRPAA